MPSKLPANPPKSETAQDAIDSAVLDAAIDELRSQAQPGRRPGINAGDLLEKLTEVEGTVSYGGTTKPENEDLVRVYSTKDNMPSDVLVMMLTKILKKRWKQDPDVPEALWGKRVFTLAPTGVYTSTAEPLLCMLHVDYPKRAHYDTLGLTGRICRKVNLQSEYHRHMHMQHRHKNELATIERDEQIQRENKFEARADRSEALSQLQVDALMELLKSMKGADNG